MIKVEKSVPIPARIRGHPKYPWRDLEPGDSFVVPGKPPRKFSNAVQAAKKKYGIRLTLRSEEGGTRVWRLPDDDTEL